MFTNLAFLFPLHLGLSLASLASQRWESVRLDKITAYLKKIFSSDLVRHGEVLDDWYKLYVPALHMVSVLIMMWINAMWYSISADLEILFHFWTRATIASAIIVLVVEIRIRKNEVTRGLYALLESKKTYVRFISHEMRFVGYKEV